MSNDPMNRSILGDICCAITPASVASQQQAENLLSQSEAALGSLGQLAIRLAGARHSARPEIARKYVIVCAADHGVVTPVLTAEGTSATTEAARQITAGDAALNAVARTAGASVLVIDCGLAGQPSDDPGLMDLRIGAGTGDIRQGPAMTGPAALASIQTGVAFMLSLADTGADCIALGQLGPGSRPVCSAILAALTGVALDELDPDDRDTVSRALAANHAVLGSSGPESAAAREPEDGPENERRVVAALAALGGHELGVLTGIILAAASLHIPVMLDEHATSTAAVLASLLSRDCAGYVIASHLGRDAAHRRALEQLGLVAHFDLGLAHGEGTGAAIALPLLDSAARLLQQSDR